jgi:hypothetical protein
MGNIPQGERNISGTKYARHLPYGKFDLPLQYPKYLIFPAVYVRRYAHPGAIQVFEYQELAAGFGTGELDPHLGTQHVVELPLPPIDKVGIGRPGIGTVAGGRIG